MSDIKQEYIPPLPISDDEDDNEAFSSNDFGAAGSSHIGNEAAATAAPIKSEQQAAASPSTNVLGNQPTPSPNGNEAFSSSDLGAAGPSHISNEAAAPNNTGQQAAAVPSTDVRGNQPAPAPSGNGGNQDQEYITLKLKHEDGNVINFRVKYTTRMDALMKKYAERTNLDLNSLRFLDQFGNRVKYAATPRTLEMEEGDEIGIYTKQEGGNGIEKSEKK
uniref:Ubiquitin-like domain-containing protein n=1 Tax=Panagrolaimus sp. PS1159 TaxID=55785 RepID=A0AC35GEV7_9BILA